MNDNEPLDEHKPAKTEIRGGDKPSDYIPQGPSPFAFSEDEDEDDFPEYED